MERDHGATGKARGAARRTLWSSRGVAEHLLFPEVPWATIGQREVLPMFREDGRTLWCRVIRRVGVVAEAPRFRLLIHRIECSDCRGCPRRGRRLKGDVPPRKLPPLLPLWSAVGEGVGCHERLVERHSEAVERRPNKRPSDPFAVVKGAVHPRQLGFPPGSKSTVTHGSRTIHLGHGDRRDRRGGVGRTGWSYLSSPSRAATRLLGVEPRTVGGAPSGAMAGVRRREIRARAHRLRPPTTLS